MYRNDALTTMSCAHACTGTRRHTMHGREGAQRGGCMAQACASALCVAPACPRRRAVAPIATRTVALGARTSDGHVATPRPVLRKGVAAL
jgi:hypothetical protein